MIFPISKRDRERYEGIRSENKVLLIGLTGGIASGKSTVAKFIKEFGGFIIDFDILARQAVIPGQKAWKEIVAYFGEDILIDNNEIDRKRLSEIVFLDAEKRKRLEGFTYPEIGKEFVNEVCRIASGEKNPIIQAIVPLLIECDMQDLFHAVTLVYCPREKQVKRLIERDGITGDMAMKIINAQMPIDEKIKYADFIINNDCSLEETKRQARILWEKLRERQEGAVNGDNPNKALIR